MFLFKLCYIDSQTDVFDEIEILTASGLRERFVQAVKEEQICPETLEEFGLDKNLDFEDVELVEIMDIFNADGYQIEQIEISATEEDLD